MSWTYAPAVPTTGTAITVAGFGAPVANAITEVHAALDLGEAIPSFANATARDAAITSPVDRMICYLVSPGAYYAHIGGAWVSLASAAKAVGTTTGTLAAGDHTHAGSATLNTQTFTSGGTWTSGASTSYAYVLLVGGGAGCQSANYGGGGGGQVKREYVTVAPSTGYTVTIGAGGSNTGSGGTSSLGALLSCAGGQPGGVTVGYGGISGGGAHGGIQPTGGAGGGGGGADGPGGPNVGNYGGSGGAGLYGYGGGGGGYGSGDGGAYGSGGAASGANAAANTGGGGGGIASGSTSGGSGICIVTWWT